MRHALCVAVLCVVAGWVSAQKLDNLLPDLEVGKVGYFKHDKFSNLFLHIVEVLEDKTLLVRGPKGKHTYFIVKDYPTKAPKGITRGKWIELKGQWKVTGTKKVEGKTHHVVEPVKEKK